MKDAWWQSSNDEIDVSHSFEADKMSKSTIYGTTHIFYNDKAKSIDKLHYGNLTPSIDLQSKSSLNFIKGK